MWTRQELKERGKAAFKANYWKSVLCAFILSLLISGAAAASGRSTGGNTDNNNTGQEISEVADGDFSDGDLSELTDAWNGLTEGQQEQAAMALFAGILGASVIIAFLSLVLKIFVFNPLQVGCYGFFRENVDYGDADLSVIKSGFGNYGHVFITLFLRDLFLALWTMLFIIPGIVKAYSYRMVPYILRDEPDLSATEVISRSRQMMKGNKWAAFVLDLSFIGWALLGIITFNLVNIFWTQPYRENTNAALYLAIK